jgi:hypothetical protein
MAQEKGSVAFLALGRETTYGTASTGPFLQLPIVTVDGGLDQPLEQSDALQGNRNRSAPELGEKTVSLTIVIQCDVRSIGFVLSEVFALPTTTVDTPSAGHNTHVWKIASSLPTGFTLEGYYAVNGLPFQWTGCKVNGFSFELMPGGFLKMTLNVVGKDQANASRIDSAPYKYSLVPLKMVLAELYEAGVQTVKATKFSLNFTNNLEAIRTVASGGTVNNHLEGWADPTVDLDLLLDSMTTYNKALNGTETSVKAKFPCPATHASHFLQFENPEVRFPVKPIGIPGPGGIKVPFAGGIAYYDNDAAASSLVVTAVNDVVAYTSIPA